MFSFPCVAFFDAIHPLNIVVLFLVILIVVGPKRIPEVARKLGRMMETFRRAADEFKAQIMAMEQEPKPEQPSNTTTDVDGVPQSSTETSPDDTYSQTYEDSPYPGNEQYYTAGMDNQHQEAEAETPPPAAEEPPPMPETPSMPEPPPMPKVSEEKPPEEDVP
jgi:Sec-independent protein translocase protein TatA